MMTRDFPAHGGNLNWAAERYGLKPEEFLDFSSNVNPLGPPAQALGAAQVALCEISQYPEPQGDSLKLALSEHLRIGQELIMLGNGSTELIHHLCQYLKPKRVAIVSPAFSEYERAAWSVGAEVVHHCLSSEQRFQLDGDRLAETAALADMIFICNPASPSGILYSREEILPVLEACRAHGGVLVVDESYMGFCPVSDARGATLATSAGNDNLVIISTLTKIYALAGVRGPGYLIADPELVSTLEENGVPWRVNTVAVAAGRAAIADGEYLKQTRELVPVWREDLRRELEATGFFEVYPSSTNFLLLRLLDPSPDAADLADGLGRKGILVRHCASFKPLDSRFLRVAVLSPPANHRLLEALVEILGLKGEKK